MADDDDFDAPGNGFPPASSILAAHLVPRLTHGHEPHLIPRETFSQLRQELLVGKQSQVRVDEGITDINKLVCIVLKAGLDASPSSSTDPENDLEGQVKDCLDIIQASLEKAPQALWDISDPLILGEEIQAPLFVWLILRLVKLATIWVSDTIQERIHQIFCSLVYFQSKQTRSSSTHNTISTFAYACISGSTLSFLFKYASVRLMTYRYFMLARELPCNGLERFISDANFNTGDARVASR